MLKVKCSVGYHQSPFRLAEGHRPEHGDRRQWTGKDLSGLQGEVSETLCVCVCVKKTAGNGSSVSAPHKKEVDKSAIFSPESECFTVCGRPYGFSEITNPRAWPCSTPDHWTETYAESVFQIRRLSEAWHMKTAISSFIPCLTTRSGSSAFLQRPGLPVAVFWSLILLCSAQAQCYYSCVSLRHLTNSSPTL